MNNEYDKNYYNLVIIFLDIKLDWSFNLLIIKGAINNAGNKTRESYEDAIIDR